jgi:uncharacterized protein YecT (DUF1311 family)
MSRVRRLVFVLFLGGLATIFVTQLSAQTVDCGKADSAAEKRICAYNELDKAEATMKVALDRALAQFAESGEKYKASDPLPKSEQADQIVSERRIRRSLLASQKAWLAYRESACGSVNDLFYLGSIADEETTFCKADLTKERTKFLNDYFNNDK